MFHPAFDELLWKSDSHLIFGLSVRLILIITSLSPQISPLSACKSYAVLTLIRGSTLSQMVRRAIRMS
jgi:hypothetical protein